MCSDGFESNGVEPESQRGRGRRRRRLHPPPRVAHPGPLAGAAGPPRRAGLRQQARPARRPGARRGDLRRRRPPRAADQGRPRRARLVPRTARHLRRSRPRYARAAWSRSPTWRWSAATTSSWCAAAASSPSTGCPCASCPPKRSPSTTPTCCAWPSTASQAKLRYSWVAFQLLPDEFTLSELRAVYSAILDPSLERLNTSNFRKAFSDAVRQRDARAGRPALDRWQESAGPASCTASSDPSAARVRASCAGTRRHASAQPGGPAGCRMTDADTDKSFDLIVVGSGAAGLSAALRAADLRRACRGADRRPAAGGVQSAGAGRRRGRDRRDDTPALHAEDTLAGRRGPERRRAVGRADALRDAARCSACATPGVPFADRPGPGGRPRAAAHPARRRRRDGPGADQRAAGRAPVSTRASRCSTTRP